MGYLLNEDIIGHAVLRGFLARSVKNKRHHAFLLAGVEHLGKDTVARALIADELNRPVASWEDLAGHPDVRVLRRADDEKNISVGDVRAFINHFSSSSFWGGRKVGVILGAHELSVEAANALLKTLEEPSGKALLVLVAHSLERLPETIKSRCQLVRFLTVPPGVINDGLLRRGLDQKTAAGSSAFSSGRPGLAVLHAEDAKLRAEHAARTNSFLQLVGGSIAGRLKIASDLTAKAETPALLSTVDVWISALRDVLSIKTGNERHAADQSSLASLRGYANSRTVRGILEAHRALAAGKKMLGENVNPRLVFEHIALSL